MAFVNSFLLQPTSISHSERLVKFNLANSLIRVVQDSEKTIFKHHSISNYLSKEENKVIPLYLLGQAVKDDEGKDAIRIECYDSLSSDMNRAMSRGMHQLSNFLPDKTLEEVALEYHNVVYHCIFPKEEFVTKSLEKNLEIKGDVVSHRSIGGRKRSETSIVKPITAAPTRPPKSEVVRNLLKATPSSFSSRELSTPPPIPPKASEKLIDDISSAWV